MRPVRLFASPLSRIAAISAIVIGLGAAPLLTNASSEAATTQSGTVITTTSGVFGTMLAVGSGKYAGYSLYFISSDTPPKFGCTTTLLSVGGGNSISCTGPSNDQHAEWPAITTSATPVAGAGVDQKMLGTVTRKGIGTQVTYAGHPLYLFDSGPGQIFGEGWDEPSRPPFHGVWWLASPSGSALAWTGALGTTTIADGKTVLSALMLTGGGFKAAPVYTFSGDSGGKSACTGACAVTWPPVLTASLPGASASIDATKIGSIELANGTRQVTYGGKPLYLYSNESVAKGKNGQSTVAGNGNGANDDGATFHLVSP